MHNARSASSIRLRDLSRRTGVHAIVAVATVLLLVSSAGAAEEALAARLGSALATPALRGAQVAALVVRGDDGRVLFARAPDDALAPASNLKVLTMIAALATFGPAHQFTTRVYAVPAPAVDGEVDILAIRGGGDPALTSEEWWRLAADLRLAGLRRVRSDIILDDSAFDQERWNAAWGTAITRAYYPAIGALSANYGSCTIEVRPGARPGDPVQVSIDPPVSYLQLVNHATTSAPTEAETLQVDRVSGPDVERIVVAGRVPRGSDPRVLHRSVADPLRYAGAVLQMQLAANGIQVGGRVRPGEVPAQATELLAFKAKTLAQIAQLLMKYSNNGMAETLVKAMAVHATGAPGTWGGGLSALRQQLTQLGVGMDGSTLLDGSGLAAANRVSPRTIVAALRLARASFAFGPEFVAALPVAGEDGTLQRRGDGVAGAVRAKTGLLNGVTGLSGYARQDDGVEVAFSILVNGYRSTDAEAMAAVDRFVTVLVHGVG